MSLYGLRSKVRSSVSTLPAPEQPGKADSEGLAQPVQPRRARSNAKLLKRASSLHRQGMLDDAAALYETVLASEPDHFEALFQLAGLRFLQGRKGEALDRFNAAVKANPASAAARSNLAAICVTSMLPEAALAHTTEALALEPDFPEVLHSRGDALRMLQRPAEALLCYDKALALRPGYVEALHNRAIALRDLQRFDEALACCGEAIALAPALAALHNTRAALLQDLGRYAEALLSCDEALALAPDFLEALGNGGNVLRALKRPAEALVCHARALAIQPDCAEILNNRGLALADLNRAEEGLASIARALSLKPNYAEAHANMAIVLSELGRFDEAGRTIRQAIALNPRRAVFYYTLTVACPAALDEPMTGAMLELARDLGLLDAKEQVFLHFALAKAFEQGDPERSFQHVLAGNALKRKQVAYDEAAMVGLLERPRAAFTKEFMRAKAGAGDPSYAPVFIFGMPRSGTTLVEQILASHPAAFGAGEANIFETTLAEFAGSGTAGPEFPGALLTLSGEQLRQIGTTCAARMRALAPAAERITDKTLENFRFAGLIHLALPNARFVHVRRDPLDTCFSCFSRLFVEGLPYTYDLGELGRYYRAYEALMAHWRAALPEGVMLEVQYEELVADLEGQAKRIAAHCGLEWNARCLEFHKTERLVRTASKTQVRQPLYQNSVGRGRLFEAQLGPLLEALRD